MRKLALLLVTFALTIPAFADTSEQAITSGITEQADAWNRGDLEGFMCGYLKSDELVFTSGEYSPVTSATITLSGGPAQVMAKASSDSASVTVNIG